MQCDLCGSQQEDILRAIIEGTELNVCSKCARYGEVIGKAERVQEPVPRAQKKHGQKKEKEITLVIVPDFAKRIKKKREDLGIKQKDFAKRIAEKESLVHNIETGNFEPSIDLAAKIERFLKIKLIEEYEEEHAAKRPRESGEGLTIGDLIKVKDKKQD